MSKSVLVLTECGADIGFGHLTRCMALAQTFRAAKQGVDVWVESDPAFAELIIEPAKAINWCRRFRELSAEISSAYGVLLDSFRVTADEVDSLAQLNPRIAVIDDFPRRRYRNGTVIDWTVGAENFAYPQREPGVCYLLGSRYCAVRPEFKRVHNRKFVGPPRALLLTFGGSDIRSLTRPVLAMLQREFPDTEKHVVIGGGFRDISYQNALEDKNTFFHTAVDAKHMRKLMAASDIAVCGGGQTLYELATQGLPPVVVSVIDNQEDDVREFARVGFALKAGAWNRLDLLDSVAIQIRELWSSAIRAKRSMAGRACVDGRGAERLVSALLEKWK